MKLINVLRKLINIHHIIMLRKLINIHKQIKLIKILNRGEQYHLYYLIKRLITNELLLKSGSNVNKIVNRILHDNSDYHHMISSKSINILLCTERWYALESKLYPMVVIKALCDMHISEVSFNHVTYVLDYLFSKINDNQKIDWRDRAGNHYLEEYFHGVTLSKNEYNTMVSIRNILQIR